jgi:CheY-like chemotaxis protein
MPNKLNSSFSNIRNPFRYGLHSDSLRGSSILLVDDDVFSLEATRSMLEHAGVVVTTAINGAEAIDELRRGKFDCVLMDVQMPVLDGLDATRQIRSDAILKDTLVLAFTTNATGTDRERCFQAGMNDVIQKPADPETMFRRLSQWIEVNRFCTNRLDIGHI